MTIKPIETRSEFLTYGHVRHSNANNNFTGFIKNNIALENNKHEFDKYDLNSFHFGAFNNKKMYACTRMVNDIKGKQKFQLTGSPCHFLKELINSHQPENGLALQDYIKNSEFEEVDFFFQSLRNDGFCFNEIGRLIRCNREGEKLLMNYLICYSWAFDRYHGIDFCFFEAVKSHNEYYRKYFNCKPVLEHLEFRPIIEGQSCYLMQADIADLTPKMDIIVNRIVDKFNDAGRPCAINIDEIR